MKLKSDGNDAPNSPPWPWDINPATTEMKNDLQGSVVNPGDTVTFSHQFMSNWNWITPYDLSSDLLNEIKDEILSKASENIGKIFDLATWWDVMMNKQIAIINVNFKFVPSSESTATIHDDIVVPISVGEIKQDAYARYLFWRAFGAAATIGGYGIDAAASKDLAAGTIDPVLAKIVLCWEGGATTANFWSKLEHKNAADPNPNYIQVVEPIPYDIHEINNSLPEGLEKTAIQESFNALSYSRAETESYIRFCAAINDSAYQYAVLQLNAARSYNDKYIERINVLTDVYRGLIHKNIPLTDKEIDFFKNQIKSQGLQPEIIDLLNREGMKDDVSNLTELVLNTDNEIIKNQSLIIDYNVELAKSRANDSVEFLNEILDINTNQLGQPVTEANLSEIEELENYKNYIQSNLDKGYKTEELKQNILLMLNASDKLIIRTNNGIYLSYYSFASEALTEYVALVDNSSPNITITGVTNGSYYNYNVTPSINIRDDNLYTQSITLNGAPFTSGTLVSKEDFYTLVASATDIAGNNASKTVNFTIDKTPPEADIRFNTTSKDIIVYNNEIGSEASYKVLPTKRGKDGKEVLDDDGKTGYELRQYTLKDLANNSLLLVLEYVKVKPGTAVKILSTQYNGGTTIATPKNNIVVSYTEKKTGALSELAQNIFAYKLFDVAAEYTAKNDKTVIVVKPEGKKPQTTTKKGMVILELLTGKGGLKYKY